MNIFSSLIFIFSIIKCSSFNLHIKNIKQHTSLKMIDIDYINNFQNALLVNGIGYSLLKNSNQKSLTSEGLTHSTILGLGLWTFLDWKGP